MNTDHDRLSAAVDAVKTTQDFLRAICRACDTNAADSVIDEMVGQLDDIVTPQAVSRYRELIDAEDPAVQAERERERQHEHPWRAAS